MASNITLSASVRQNLLSLQSTAEMMSTTQNRLATGKKVNSALDNPSNFFTSQSLSNRASDLNSLLDSIGQAQQTLKAADQGITSLTKLVTSAKSIAKQAQQTAVQTERDNLLGQYNDILDQIDTLAADASYNGINLLNGDDLKVVFNEDGSSSQDITGVDFTSSGLSLAAQTAGDFDDNADVDLVIADLDAALGTLRSQAAAFGSNLTTVQIRQDFTKNMVNTLQTGADSLVLADTNEEGANLLALQTRQQLSTTALSLSAQADQAVLRLF